MTTFENVVLTPTPATVTAGESVTITLAGTATAPTSATLDVTINLSTPDGSTGTAVVPLTVTGTEQIAATIVSATDDASHTWAVASNGLSASTTA